MHERSNCQHQLDHQKSKRAPEKTSTSASLTTSKPLTVDHNKLWKTLQEMGNADHLTCLLRNLYAGQQATIRMDMEQQTGSRLGKEYVKAVYCHPAYLTYMQSTSWEMLGWMKPKLESRLLGEISITSDMQITPPYDRKRRRTKEPLDESERGEWKSWLKIQHLEN